MRPVVFASGENGLVNRLRLVEQDCKKDYYERETLPELFALVWRLQVQVKLAEEQACFVNAVVELARAFKRQKDLGTAKRCLVGLVQILYAVPGDISGKILGQRALVMRELAGLAQPSDEPNNKTTPATPAIDRTIEKD